MYQIDNPYVDTENNGLSYLAEAFKGESIAAHITLSKGERSERRLASTFSEHQVELLSGNDVDPAWARSKNRVSLG